MTDGATKEAVFRVAEPADLDVLLRMMQAFYALDGYPFDEARARVAAEGLIGASSLGQVWIIDDRTVPIGYLVVTLGYSFEYEGRDAFIDEIYVAPSHRGRGIGQRAIAIAEKACRSLGVRALHLEVERDNHAAQAIYRKAGFKDQDRYLMTKRLV